MSQPAPAQTRAEEHRKELEELICKYLPPEDFEFIYHRLVELDAYPSASEIDQRLQIKKVMLAAEALQRALNSIEPDAYMWLKAAQLAIVAAKPEVVPTSFEKPEKAPEQKARLLDEAQYLKQVGKTALYLMGGTGKGRPKNTELSSVAYFVGAHLKERGITPTVTQTGPLVEILEGIIRIMQTKTSSAVHLARTTVDYFNRLPPDSKLSDLLDLAP